MELGIQGRIGNQLPVQTKQNPVQVVPVGQNETIKEAAMEAAFDAQSLRKAMGVSKEEIDKYIRSVLRDTSLLNRDFKYSVNRETNQLIVKVIDKTTNKVIKEIPPESLQKLALQLKEQLGILVDEQI
jgi:flagellar protein FlaG